MTRKRVFIALLLSAALQETILDWQKQFKNTYPQIADKLRFIPPQNAHVTLIPPWYADDQEVETTQNKLQNIKSTPFSWQLDRISLGPEKRHPHLIWASGPTPPALLELKSEIEKQLAIPSAKRLFTLHLTLVRFKTEDYAGFKGQNIDATINWQEEATAFSFLESKLSSSGAQYFTLATFPFKS